jgi:mono/diheme cytochrome c family protein
MRKLLKIISIAAVVFLLLIAGGFIYFNMSYPKSEPAKNITIKATPEMIARGKYLANHVTVCIDCHSTRDWSKFSGPIVPGTEAKGGDKFGPELGFPGNIYAKNITPAGIGDWTDGEIIRAITTGVNKHNEALFPLMPYYNYNQMSEEDLHAIVAYLRTLRPIENKVAATELDFPLNYIVKTMPIDTYVPHRTVDKTNSIAYGKYLVTMASCNECHTQMDKEMKPVPGMAFAGGREFTAPFGTIAMDNVCWND